MSPSELQAHLRKVHGIADGVTYDPALHEEVPLLCFGRIPGSNSMAGPGQHLRPEQDLLDILKGQAIGAGDHHE